MWTNTYPGYNRLVTVTRFKIWELSAVGIGFDAGAVKREQEKEQKERVEFEKRLQILENKPMFKTK